MLKTNEACDTADYIHREVLIYYRIKSLLTGIEC